MAEIKISAGKGLGENISFGSVGTKDHSKMKNLDYENSGHTGFQKELTFDDTPTSGSNNPVKSGGIKTELDKKADSDSVYTKAETNTELGKKADANNVYTILETEARLAQKADTNTVYTKTETNTELNKKADKANGLGGFNGGNGSSAIYGGATGNGAVTIMGGSVGNGAVSGNGFSGGANAKVADTSGSAFIDAIQLGTGTNNSEKTLQIYDYQLMDANGHIPNDRMPTKADKSASIPHTTVSGYPIALTDHLGGENVLDYKIYGNSIQNGTPAADTPIDIQSVGDLVTDTASEYYGKYDIPLYVGGVLITHIYLNAPLRKVGNSADYIDFKTQKVVRYIKEQTFDGTENWFYRESDTLLYLTAVPNMASSSYCVSTHFLDESRKDTGSTPYVRPVTNVLRIYQQQDNVPWSSAAEFKAFLAAQKTAGTPLIIDYILSEPTEENISISNFSLTAADSVNISAGTETAPSKIDLEYYQDINKVIAEIKAAILSNGGNV